MTDITTDSKEEHLNIVDTASLTFFTNPLYYSILQRKKLCQLKDNSAEIKFYRKRIISLFKDLLKGEDEPLNKEIKEIHTMFVNASIRYFEITDKKDIVQGQHIQSQHIQSEHIQEDQADQTSVDQTPEDILNAIGGKDIYSLDEANDIMMRKTITMANLDNYVITKQDTSTNDVRIIPMKMEIDLKATSLKDKGVPPKKSKKKKEDLSN
jgi:hypothetical protein